jgi:hypothetical protein
MAIYLDQKRRCDNCLSELGTEPAVPCKGTKFINFYDCHKTELCTQCAGKQYGWCDACTEKDLQEEIFLSAYFED